MSNDPRDPITGLPASAGEPIDPSLDLRAWRTQRRGAGFYGYGVGAPQLIGTPGMPPAMLGPGVNRITILQKPFTVGVAGMELLPQDLRRSYLLILNTSTVNQLFVGFDVIPSALNGLVLPFPLGGFEWLYSIPTNAINIVGQAAGVTGICLYASGDV
jgi:hypothetical protein